MSNFSHSDVDGLDDKNVTGIKKKALLKENEELRRRIQQLESNGATSDEEPIVRHEGASSPISRSVRVLVQNIFIKIVSKVFFELLRRSNELNFYLFFEKKIF